MEKDSMEDIAGIEPEVITTAVGDLNPQQMEEFNLEELKKLKEEYEDALNKTVEDIIGGTEGKSLDKFNNYVSSVFKSLLKDTQDKDGLNVEEPRELVLELVSRISEGTIKGFIPVTAFIGILLNLPSNNHYQSFKDLNTKFNDMFNK